MSTATATATIPTYGIPTTAEPLATTAPTATATIPTYGIPTTAEPLATTAPTATATIPTYGIPTTTEPLATTAPTATATIPTYGIPTTTEPLATTAPTATATIPTYGIPTTAEAPGGEPAGSHAPLGAATVSRGASRPRGYRVAPLFEALSPHPPADPQRPSAPTAPPLSAPTLSQGSLEPVIGGSVSYLDTADPARVEADAADSGLAPAALRRQIARYAALAAVR